MISKSYLELIEIDSFKGRLEYLRLNGTVSEQTFGGHRYLNQILYSTPEWKAIRKKVILRDSCRDLGVEGHEIYYKPTIHHINPITMDDILYRKSNVFDMNNLITVSDSTHKAIHYGNSELPNNEFVERRPFDTCPWKL